jgi:hypothetical protein
VQRHGRHAAALFALLLAGLACPRMASAEPLADATCPGPHTTVPGGMNPRFAQTFTVLNTGTLTSASLVVDKFAGGNGWTFSVNTIAGGVPTDNALTSVAVPESEIPPNDVTPISVSFPNPLPVASGQQYALAVSRAAGQGGVGARTGDPCSGGLFQSSGGGPFLPAGTGSLDMVYTIFVEPTPPDTTAPLATITGGPKDKTRKKTATFEFTGTDARAVASFQCSLDGSAFATCSSPHMVKVKKGKHALQVQAIDEAGNVGVPATDTWKRKRKKK